MQFESYICHCKSCKYAWDSLRDMVLKGDLSAILITDDADYPNDRFQLITLKYRVVRKLAKN